MTISIWHLMFKNYSLVDENLFLDTKCKIKAFLDIVLDNGHLDENIFNITWKFCTPNFLNIIIEINMCGHFPEKDILVTMDASSLYTNISIEDGLNFMKETVEDLWPN